MGGAVVALPLGAWHRRGAVGQRAASHSITSGSRGGREGA